MEVCVHQLSSKQKDRKVNPNVNQIPKSYFRFLGDDWMTKKSWDLAEIRSTMDRMAPRKWIRWPLTWRTAMRLDADCEGAKVLCFRDMESVAH